MDEGLLSSGLWIGMFKSYSCVLQQGILPFQCLFLFSIISGFFNQSYLTKINCDCVTRVFPALLVFTLSSHWLLIKFSFLVIGCSDCVGFGFTSLNWKALFLLRRPFRFCLRRTSNIFEIRKEDLTQFVVTFQQTELLGKLSGFKSLSYVQGLLFKVTYVATDRHS